MYTNNQLYTVGITAKLHKPTVLLLPGTESIEESGGEFGEGRRLTVNIPSLYE